MNDNGICLDIVIVGAGISGINAAYRVQSQLRCSYAILEAREAIGGTWDIFRYPGVRSDSDLFTFGFPWQPWEKDSPIAEGEDILKYMGEAASNHGIDKNIRFNHKVVSASWSSTRNMWRLSVAQGLGETITYTARFIIFSTGYYNYDQPLYSEIPGLQTFQGALIHPQFWPKDFDYANKKVVVIGSGATAFTLIPALAEKANRVTMLQRSPSYISSVSNTGLLSLFLPQKLNRLWWILAAQLFYLFCQKFPKVSRWLLRREVSKELPEHIPHDPHFEPKYNPWDQRLCVCPNGDFFKSLHTGKADVKTDTIKKVTKDGILLDSGGVLDSDVIVTATGLKLQSGGGVKIDIDKEPVDITEKMMWRGVMIQDLPNASFPLGYTNASWTLGADATALCTTRLVKYMEKNRLVSVTPRLSGQVHPRKLLNLNSTYINTAEKSLPKAGDRGPWLPRSNYFTDILIAKYAPLGDSLQKVEGKRFRLSTKLD